MERFTSLATYKPWERRRLLDLAALRNTLVVLWALAWISVRTAGWPHAVQSGLWELSGLAWTLASQVNGLTALLASSPPAAWPPWLILALAPCDACLMALISADWIEHRLKILVFGYPYNPNVMARGELEGANTIMVAEQEDEWRARMWTHLAIGDDPGSRHYDFPRPWRRRWCALFRDD